MSSCCWRAGSGWLSCRRCECVRLTITLTTFQAGLEGGPDGTTCGTTDKAASQGESRNVRIVRQQGPLDTDTSFEVLPLNLA